MRVSYWVRLIIAFVSLALAHGSSGVALAQAEDEPAPESADEPGAREGSDPAADPAATNATDDAEEPESGAASGSQPKDAQTKDAQTKTGAEPSQPDALVSRPPPSEASTLYGVGVHLRAIFVPEWLLNLFLDASTPLNSAAFGAEFVRRKGNFDIIGSVDFGFYSPRDGNYLGNGDDPATETDYLHFDGLSALAFSVHFLRHEGILDWLSFVWGGGVGLAVVLGDVFRASSKGCTKDNVDDLAACHPDFPDYSVGSDAWKKNGDNYGNQDQDSTNSPKIFKEDDVPPVVPLIHLLVGFDFKIADSFSVRVDGGFRNAFYVGATGHYFF